MKMGNKHLDRIIAEAPFGYAYHEIIINDQGNPIDYRYLEVNKAFERMMGLKASEIIGKTALQVLPALNHHPAHWIATAGEIALDGKKKDFTDYSGVLKSWLKVHLYSPEKGFFVAIFTEINLQEELLHIDQDAEKSLIDEKIRFQAQLLDAITSAVIATNKEGIVIYWNPKAGQLYGWSAEEAIGKKIVDLTPLEQSRDRANEILDDLRKGNSWSGEFWVRCKDGKQFPAFVTNAPIMDSRGQLIGIIGISNDISQQKLTKAALVESEKRFRGFFENASVGIYRTSIEGKILMANPALIKILGYETFEELSQRDLSSEGYDPEYPRSEFQVRIERDGVVRGMESAWRLHDGTVIHLLESAWLVRDEQGKGLYYEGVVEDITSQKKALKELTKAQEKYRLIFEKSTLGIMHIDTQGGITDCNEKLVEIIGTPREKLIGLDASKFPHVMVAENVSRAMLGESSIFEGEYTSVFTQKTTPVRGLFSPIMDNETIAGVMVLVEDRTDHLEKEKYEKQIAIASESVRFKQNFLANMSHEIRTPLTGIMGVIDILSESNLDAHQKEHIEILMNTSENLMEIINQVLDFSKIEAGKLSLKFSDFNFHEYIKRATLFYQGLCNANTDLVTDIDLQIPGTIRADKSRISQILNNLLSNAIKFTPEGRIEVSASVEPFPLHDKESGTYDDDDIIIRVSVSDSGIGIREEKQKTLFQPFVQVDDSDNRRYDGTGLGLSICKQLAELHGGKIGLSSVPAKGSTFWFTFRAKVPMGSDGFAANQLYVNPRPIDNLRILLAEDKLFNQKVVSLMLSHMGHEVTLAGNGYQVLEIYRPDRFDLILMDIQMPQMDGITATRKLRESYIHLPPIVGLSANAFEGDREKYMEQGLDDYLTKPLRKDEFQEMLSRVILQD
jgi:PAS domain S-box-containing protein